MNSYFFIPGTRLHKIGVIQALKVTAIIIDLEDAVKGTERQSIIDTVIVDDTFKNYFFRVPLYDQNNQLLNLDIFDRLVNSGIKNFVLPKLYNKKDLLYITDKSKYKHLKFLLLIESPRFFLEIEDVLLYNRPKQITGIGLGSHDFMAEIGGVHHLKNLDYIRTQLLYLARATDITAIDIASMELKNAENFRNEMIDGFEKGYDAKFFIHPWQMELKNDLILYNQEDLDWALEVKSVLKSVGDRDEFNPIVIKGNIIEKPHILKMQKILDYFKYESK